MTQLCLGKPESGPIAIAVSNTGHAAKSTYVYFKSVCPSFNSCPCDNTTDVWKIDNVVSVEMVYHLLSLYFVASKYADPVKAFISQPPFVLLGPKNVKWL